MRAALLAGALALLAGSPPAVHAATGGAVAPACVPSRLNVSAALAGGRLTVSPEPDSLDASAQTQISMLGAPAADLAGVTVSGSRSGAHSGRLLAYSQGDGASFLPTLPFAGGEVVTVHGRLLRAGGSIPFAWRFTVAVRDVPGATSNAVGTGRSRSTAAPVPPREYQRFRSQPQLRPPDVTVSAKAQSATGDLLLAPYSGNGQYGPMILDEHGGLIWFKALSPPGARAADLHVQEFEGKPVLTWWQDPLVVGHDSSAGEVIADSSYRQIAYVRAGNGYQPDLHEFHITRQGTALITVYDAIDCDLSSVGGPSDGALADTLVQEIDLKTGLVTYEWHSVDHVPLAASYNSAAPTSRAEPFDPFHINSIDVQQDGDLLVDSRNTWAAYDVAPTTGQVRWQLGGKHSSFKLGPGTATAWQHDARQQPDGAITFFDNGASPREHPQSRAIEVALDSKTRTATLVRSYVHRNPLVAGSQGNVQALAGGDWMIGWGQAGYLSEVGPSGQLLFNAHLPPGWETYRTYAQPWSGRPSEPPAVAVDRGAHGQLVLYASWNGATDVASWRALAGASPTSLAPLATAPRNGFETALELPAGTSAAYVAVQALDSTGSVIAASSPVRG